MSAAESVLEVLKGSGPLSDSAIAEILHLRHQHVNQVCRRLIEQRRLIREAGPEGLLINRLPGQQLPPQRETQIVDGAGELLTEDEIKQAVKDHLEREGYEVQVMWGRNRGIDIDAVGPKGRIIIEAKGQVQSQQQQTNYFLNALGELIQRMDDPEATYALALPDEPRSRGLVSRLPDLSKRRLRLTVFFVNRERGSLSVESVGDERRISESLREM